MGQTKSSIMDEIREQVRHRLCVKYSWKRTPHSSIEKLQKRFGKMLFPKPHVKRYLNHQDVDLGIDDFGREVTSGVLEYVHLLLNRDVQLHTLIVLGSRAKGRAKPGSDIDVTVIASNLPGKSSPEFANIPKKILNIQRWLVLNDAPIFMGIQPSLCCSREEFLQWLGEFRLVTLDAIFYGKVMYDNGFWRYVLTKFREIEGKYGLSEKDLKTLLIAL